MYTRFPTDTTSYVRGVVGVVVPREPYRGREHDPAPRGWGEVFCVLSYRLISTGQLHTLRCFHIRPINPVVYWGPYQVNPVGNLILKQASRLDAFSGYPFRT